MYGYVKISCMTCKKEWVMNANGQLCPYCGSHMHDYQDTVTVTEYIEYLEKRVNDNSPVEVNLNNRVRFRPNEAGLTLMEANHNLLKIAYPKVKLGEFDAGLDAEGYSEMSLYSFMNTFGDFLGPARLEVVDINVYIKPNAKR